MILHYVAARRATFVLFRLASMNLACRADQDGAFNQGEFDMGMHDKPLSPPKCDKTELAKVGKGQPVDDVKMFEEMEEDRMDRLIGTTAGGGKADQDRMVDLANVKRS